MPGGGCGAFDKLFDVFVGASKESLETVLFHRRSNILVVVSISRCRHRLDLLALFLWWRPVVLLGGKNNRSGSDRIVLPNLGVSKECMCNHRLHFYLDSRGILQPQGDASTCWRFARTEVGFRLTEDRLSISLRLGHHETGERLSPRSSLRLAFPILAGAPHNAPIPADAGTSCASGRVHLSSDPAPIPALVHSVRPETASAPRSRRRRLLSHSRPVTFAPLPYLRAGRSRSTLRVTLRRRWAAAARSRYTARTSAVSEA
jgi:hypothetical protein